MSAVLASAISFSQADSRSDAALLDRRYLIGAGLNPTYVSSPQPRTMPDGARLLDHTTFADINGEVWNNGMNTNGRRAPPQSGTFVGASTPLSSSSISNQPFAPPGLSREHSANTAPFAYLSSPPSSHQAPAPPLAAPRAMQPYPRLTSPQPADPTGGRSPSPTKRSFNFPMGDPTERWNSIGQAAQSSGTRTTAPRKHSIHSNLGAPSAAEPFLGYNELFSPNGSHLSSSDVSKAANLSSLSTSDPMNAAFSTSLGPDSRGFPLSASQEQDAFASRYGMPPGQFSSHREENPFSGPHGANPRSAGLDDFGGRQPFNSGAPGMPGMPPPGNLSPRSMMHFHHQQMQAQSMAMQAQQQGGQGGIGNASLLGSQSGPAEEITTVFIVGFPDDMTEREFANMFLFAKGFEASTLKIPAGLNHAGPGSRTSDAGGTLSVGPGGPYQAVNLPGSGLFDVPNSAGGSWEDQNLSLALSRAGASDAFSSLANMGNPLNALGGASNPNAQSAAANAAAGGKIKQIIGFAKFRTRTDALEARDALNGRKIDAEKGCVLKTEMAKKNLHTKQRPVLSGPGMPEGNPAFPPSNLGGPGGPPPPPGSSGHQQPPPNAPFGAAGPFDPRSGPNSGGPFGSFQAGKAAPNFETFPGQQPPNSGGHMTPGDLLSPQEMFGGGAGGDFFSQGGPPGLRPPISSGAEPSNRQSLPPSNDKWGASMGPLDYYGPDSAAGPLPAPGRSVPTGPNPNVGRPDWGTVGSPPGLYNLNAPPTGSGPGAIRPGFQRQGSRGAPPSGPTSDNGHSVMAPTAGPIGKPEEFSRGADSTTSGRIASSPTSAGNESSEQQQQPIGVSSRFGSLKLSSPTSEDDPTATNQAAKPANQVPSPELHSPTSRAVVGDNHPPGNTLFVGNLPSNASSAVISQIEDQLRSLFGNCRGFRQFSFRLKSNGPMCFVEFDDVHTASKAMSELNGNSLGGAIKNGGIRLSFSKNPLFRMNSNSAMNAGSAGSAGQAGSGSGSSAGSGATPDNQNQQAQMSLGSASESLTGTTRR